MHELGAAMLWTTIHTLSNPLSHQTSPYGSTVEIFHTCIYHRGENTDVGAVNTCTADMCFQDVGKLKVDLPFRSEDRGGSGMLPRCRPHHMLRTCGSYEVFRVKSCETLALPVLRLGGSRGRVTVCLSSADTSGRNNNGSLKAQMIGHADLCKTAPVAASEAA